MSDVRITTTEPSIDGSTVVRSIQVFTFSGSASSGGGTGAVDSVNGKTGAVVLAPSDIGAQPSDSDLTAIAALSTTAFGRALLALADAAALRTAAGLGSAATQPSTAFDAAGAAAVAQAASQPLDTDLTAIAALATTTFGRSLLTAADAAAARALTGAGTSSFDGAYSSLTGKPTLGTAAAADTGAFDPAGSAAAAQSTAEGYTDTKVAAEVTRANTAYDATGAAATAVAAEVSRADAAYATAAQGGKADTAVQPARTVNGHALSADVTVTAADVSAVPTTRTVNSKALSADITLTAADVSAVPTTRTVAGHALSSDVTLADADISPTTPNDQTGTAYTFVLADGARLVTGNNASAQTFTIPPNSSVAYPLGTSLQVYNKGAGLITWAAGSGVTIRTPRGAKIAVQYGLSQAVQVVADTWVIAGDVTT
jgi:hypothetical protein